MTLKISTRRIPNMAKSKTTLLNRATSRLPTTKLRLTISLISKSTPNQKTKKSFGNDLCNLRRLYTSLKNSTIWTVGTSSNWTACDFSRSNCQPSGRRATISRSWEKCKIKRLKSLFIIMIRSSWCMGSRTAYRLIRGRYSYRVLNCFTKRARQGQRWKRRCRRTG